MQACTSQSYNKKRGKKKAGGRRQKAGGEGRPFRRDDEKVVCP
jgi:hypothetical protein